MNFFRHTVERFYRTLTHVLYDDDIYLAVLRMTLRIAPFQISGKPPEHLDDFQFDNFDQVDDAQRPHDEDKNSALAAVEFDALDNASKDLLNRLLEKSPCWHFSASLSFITSTSMKCDIKR